MANCPIRGCFSKSFETSFSEFCRFGLFVREKQRRSAKVTTDPKLPTTTLKKSRGDNDRRREKLFYALRKKANNPFSFFPFKLTNISYMNNDPFQAHAWPTHGSELPYVFGVPLMPEIWRHVAHGFTPNEVDLSRAVMTHWTNFAKSGYVSKARMSLVSVNKVRVLRSFSALTYELFLSF